MAWYDVGTVSVTNGSTTVTGAGTDFISGVQVGEGLYIGGDLYEIGVVNSSTQLTLSDAYLGSTATGQAYKIIPTQSLVADLSSGVADLISDFADVRDYAGNGKFNDGTQASPAITFTQDQNNGLYRIGSDNWGLAAGGAKALEIKTTGVKLDDGKKITFGASDDLQIYHSGTHSYISEQGTGNLNILASSSINLLNSDSSDYMARFNDSGSNQFFYNGSQKLATTSTGVDVTGTVTTDGLTVGGTGTFGDLPSKIKVGLNGDSISSDADLYIQTSTADPLILRTNFTQRQRIDANGDVSFYEDTGTTAKMVWDASAESLSVSGKGNFGGDSAFSGDGTIHAIGSLGIGSATNLNPAINRWSLRARAGGVDGAFDIYDARYSQSRLTINSAGNVGIGTLSPSSALHVRGSGNPTLTIDGSYSAYTSFLTLKAGGAGASVIRAEGGTNALLFQTNGDSERARIDSSGNLLVGKSSSNFGTTGVETKGGGSAQRLWSTSSSTAPLALNRLTSDGNIAEFFKNGSTVGSIGAKGGEITIGSGDVGLRFYALDDAIYPARGDTGAGRGDAISLGYPTQRFKDLYLSGGVYLGGTGAANKLDDYEEGLHSIQCGDSSSYASASDTVVYTKVGNVVTLTCRLTNINTTGLTGTDQARFTVPFVAGSEYSYGTVYVRSAGTSGFSGTHGIAITNSFDYFVITHVDSGGGMLVEDIANGITDLFFTFTYVVA